MTTQTPPTAPVTDHRVPPRGVLPRGVQAWLMAGLAVGLLLIILLTGKPTPPSRPAPAAAPTTTPSPERLSDYQQRLRALDERSRLNLQNGAESTPTAPTLVPETNAQPVDPLAEDRRRREYESLFATNLVLSRRTGNDRPATAATSPSSTPAAASSDAPPSLDDVADAVVRAAGRSAPPGDSPAGAVDTTNRQEAEHRAPGGAEPQATAGPPVPTGARHRLIEGTLIETVLTTRLDGASAAPVMCLVTTPVYASEGLLVLIPAGARLLGMTRPVQAWGETRLAVTFHRLVLPNGLSYGLRQFTGLNQAGDAGLRDRVNHHYLATFGAAAAVGVVAGLGQLVGNAGLSDGQRDRTVVVAGGVGDATSQAASQVMARFLNRLPTVSIREGHRVRVYVTSDLELPAYDSAINSGRS
jgi:type IV secretion system protein TrbI